MLSFWKLLLLVLVIGGVWVGFTIYRRNERQRAIREAAQAQVGHVKTVACPVCGTYVPERGAASCGRADCPF